MARTSRAERWIVSEKYTVPPLVSEEVWDKAQATLASQKKGKRGPRKASQWLKGFVVCGRCGQPMWAIDAEATSRVPRSYFCKTRADGGPNNSTGCRWHRLRAEIVEEILSRYLNETRPVVQASLREQRENVLEPLVKEISEKNENCPDILPHEEVFEASFREQEVVPQMVS